MPENGTARRRRWLAAIPAAILAMAIAGCSSAGSGGSGGSTSAGSASASASGSSAQSPPAAAACSPAGTSLSIAARNIKFSKSCLAAPAGKPFTITFANDDHGVPHDIAIYANSSATKTLFKGQIVTGTKTTVYHVPALPAGTHYFRCDVHPTAMHGTFVVG